MTVRAGLAHVFAARDPGRARLIVATAISLAVLGSALLTLAVVNRLHADSALLAMSVFLSVQAGNAAKDRTSAARVVTTALLVPTVLVAVAVAALLSPWRAAEIAVLVALTGAATWVRRFGARAGALGTMGFLGYFFTLFMQPTHDELPVYCLVAVMAVSTQLVARTFLLLKRPRRQLELLLSELRTASASALRAASRAEHAHALRARLARIDALGRAITSWQQSFRTDLFVSCDEQALAELVLDARVDTEELCFELARAAASTRSAESADPARNAVHLGIVLDERATPTQIAETRSWAEDVLAQGELAGPASLADYLEARSTIAHVRIRELDLAHAAEPHAASAPQHEPEAEAETEHSRVGVDEVAPTRVRRLTPWRQWTPATRLAVQAMLAASLAAVVGEAISASRWYWAVMTAFVIFAGTTTRGDILTRASRRVAGTVGGIAVGVAGALLAQHDTGVLIAICLISVFAMLYFGPVNYVYASFFTTVMLVAIYGMLGVLDDGILELRLVETLAGAIIGVVCAYLILSSSSHPALQAKIDAYFSALDRLLEAGSAPFGSGAQRGALVTAVHELEAAQTDVERSVSAMSTAFLGSRRDLEVSAVRLMSLSTRSAARFAQSVIAREGDGRHQRLSDDARESLALAVGEVRSIARAAHLVFEGSRTATVSPDGSAVLSTADHVRSTSPSSEADAFLALARIDWAMRRMIDVATSDGHRREAMQ